MIDLQRSPIKGPHAWAIVVATIALIDLSAQENQTLSSACHRAVQRNPVLIWAALILTLLHLGLGHTTYARFDIYRFVELLRHRKIPGLLADNR